MMLKLIDSAKGVRVWKRRDGALLIAYIGWLKIEKRTFGGWRIKENREWYGRLTFPFAVDISRDDVRKFVRGHPLRRWDDNLVWFRGCI